MADFIKEIGHDFYGSPVETHGATFLPIISVFCSARSRIPPENGVSVSENNLLNLLQNISTYLQSPML